MNNKKMEKFFLLIILLGRINYSFSLMDNDLIRVIGRDTKALECFRNPNRSDAANDCTKVSKYMKALNYGEKEIINSKHAINIMAAIQADSWNIQSLDFQDCAIDTEIFKATPPPQVKRIILSKNIALKESVISIPDRFISNLSSCPFQSDDNIRVNNCSAKLKSICSSNINCVVSNNSNTKPQNPQNNNIPNKNISTLPSSTVNPITTINEISSTPTNINLNDTISNPINNDIDPKKNTNKNDTVINNENENPSSNVQIVDNHDTSDKADRTKSLIHTFLFGLLTSFGILVFLLLLLCFVQKHSKKNIVGLKKLTEYYERKPLVKGEKSPSSSMNDTASMNDYGTQSTHSNYAVSNSSQTSSSQTKHKRYLYVFDDGSVMMSKSLNSNKLILQSNAVNSHTSLTHNSIPTNYATISSNINNIGKLIYCKNDKINIFLNNIS